MNINDYRETISDIKATESLKKRIINTLKSGEETKRLKFNKQVIIAVAACLTVAIMIPVLVLTVILPSVTPVVGSNNPSATGSKNAAASNSVSGSVSEDTSDTISGPVSELPKLVVGEIRGRSGGGNIDFIYIDDLNKKSSNPWNEDSTIETFPIYENFTINLSEAEMKDKGKEIAEKLNLTVRTSTFFNDKPERNSIVTSCDNLDITVNARGGIGITFRQAEEIPDEYNLIENISERKAKIADYLIDKYKNIAGMKEPSLDIESIDMNESEYSIVVFDNGGSLTDKIVGYWLNRMFFYIDGGKLKRIAIDNMTMNKKAGDYPIITIGEAKKLLLGNKYFSNYYDIPKEENIYKVEFRMRLLDDFLIPYYVFYIETSEEYDNNKIFGDYYVPAVESKYITNFPTEPTYFH